MFQKIINNDEATGDKAPHVPKNTQASQPAAAPAQPSATPQPQGSSGYRNRLSSDVEIKGTIRFKDELIVDGKVEGEISSAGALAILENARIRAEITVGSVVIQGKVHGNITASKTVELRAGSEVVGDIKAAVLTMEAGSIFVGRSEVGAPSSKPASKPAQNKPQQGSPKPQQSQPNNGQQPGKTVVKAS